MWARFRASPVDDGGHEHRADAKPAVRLCDLHAEIGAAAGQVRIGLTDDPSTIFHHEANHVWIIDV